MRVYLPLIRKDFVTHMHSVADYVKEGVPFTWDLFLEKSADSYLCLQRALLHSVTYFFFLYGSPSCLSGLQKIEILVPVFSCTNEHVWVHLSPSIKTFTLYK